MNKNIIDILKNDGVGILPTDTLYGLVGRASSKKVFDRIFNLKNRDSKKPFIILINSIEDLKLFEIEIDDETRKILEKFWPGKVSVILPCDNEKFSYLSMGTGTLAFRIPNKKDLLDLLKATGPLLAPSANPSGESPALTIEEAKEYFGDLSPTTFVLKRIWHLLSRKEFYNIYDVSQNFKKLFKILFNNTKVVEDKVDFYVDEGKLESLPSTLIKIENGKIVVLREGAIYID